MQISSRLLAAVFLLAATPALAAGSTKLAPPGKLESMQGDVGVYGATDDVTCDVTLYDTKVPGGYRIEQYENCATTFPVMTKVKAWRAYKDGEMSFADADGHDLIRFRGKEYHFFAIEKVDGIVKLLSAQESAE